MSAYPRELPWRGERTLEYPNVVIELASEPELRESESEPDRFILGKSKSMLLNMMSAVAQIKVSNVVDVGIYKGGSAVFFNECFRPDKLVAIDLQRAPRALMEYAAAQTSDSLEVHDQVNQADGARLEEICDAAFGDEPIDLIVDDASHLYAQSRATFSFLFPRLRENGLYIIEDWGWAHWPGAHWQEERGGMYFAEEAPCRTFSSRSCSSPRVANRSFRASR